MSRAAALWFIAVAVLAAGCGGEAEPDAEPSASAPTTEAATESAASGIVGRWEQVHSCEQLVKALEKAGLRAVAPAMVGDYFPGQSPKQLARKPDVCAGAKPEPHSHFFTEDGSFGSLDEEGNQVDDARYEVVDDHLLRIGADEIGGEFQYRIVDDRELILHPVIKEADKRRALARPLQFSPAGWQVAVSYDGLPWKRVDCAGWC